ncbi:hypothetical protein BC332_33069 [Capsicum chinense]|nr:hypothetical protein BC332_33069 [Capsicum chinense]
MQREVNTYSIPNAYERQKIERSKGVQSGNLRVEKGEVVWSKARGLSPNRANIVCPSICKDICGTCSGTALVDKIDCCGDYFSSGSVERGKVGAALALVRWRGREKQRQSESESGHQRGPRFFKLVDYFVVVDPGVGVDSSEKVLVVWGVPSMHIFVDRTSMILYFDVKLDEVKNLPTPDFVGENDFFYLTSVKGCLSLYGGRIETKELDIWIMEQDGRWKWLLNITFPVLAKPLYKIRVLLGCRKNGDIVFQVWHCCRRYP